MNIKQVASELSYRDKRSVIRFCEKQNIRIFNIGNNQCVIQEDFELEKMKHIMKYLKEKYGDNFMEVLKAKMDFYVEYRTVVEEKAKRKQQNQGEDIHTPQGFYEKRFLDELRKL